MTKCSISWVYDVIFCCMLIKVWRGGGGVEFVLYTNKGLVVDRIRYNEDHCHFISFKGVWYESIKGGGGYGIGTCLVFSNSFL